MHFWNRELINHSRFQNDHQRYQFALAALRLGKVSESRQAIQEGTSAFQNQAKTRLLLIELDIKDKKFDLAKQTLLLTKKLCQPSSELSTKWEQLMARCQPHPIRHEKSNHPKSLAEWQRILSLSQNQPDVIIDFLQWISYQHQLEIPYSLKQIPSFAKFTSFQLYQVFNALKEKPQYWDQLIDILFSIATQKNKESEKMWLSWLKHCPNSHKNGLHHKMKSILLKSPNWKLENILNQSIKEHTNSAKRMKE